MTTKQQTMRSLTVLLALAIVFALFPRSQATVLAANPGDVVINEIMQNPAAVGDDVGEWFELYNLTATGIDINGWTVRDNDIDSHVINNSGPLVIPAGGLGPAASGW